MPSDDDTQDVADVIEVPNRTSEWGRAIIDQLNVHFKKTKQQIDTVNSNFNKRFDNFETEILAAKTTANLALKIAEDNKKELGEIRNDMNYLQFTCKQLYTENALLKQKSTMLENYSRRDNIVIRGVLETKDETNDECELKARTFLEHNLKLDKNKVKTMKFVRVHRLGSKTPKQQIRGQQPRAGTAFNRPIIIRFSDYSDKVMVWKARNNISDASKCSISENFSSDTDFRRKRLYPIYKYAKSQPKYQKKISLNSDILTINSIRYSVDDLQKLPDDLQIRSFCEKSSGENIIFGGILSEYCPYSNWYPSRMRYDGHVFGCLEQSYQYAKAVHCKDEHSALKLRFTTDPRSAKEIGSKVTGYDRANWDAIKDNKMLELVKIKFSDPKLKAALISSGTKQLVEAGLNEHFAVGVSFNSRDISDPTKWKGSNKLGEILCTVRNDLN